MNYVQNNIVIIIKAPQGLDIIKFNKLFIKQKPY